MSAISEKLEEGLLERYERCKVAVSAAATEDETKHAESEMNKVLADMQTYVKTDEEAYAKEEERRIEEDHNEKTLDLEYAKLQEHRIVEDRRNAAAADLEREKRKLTGKSVAFDMAKIVVPAVLSIGAYFVAQNRVLQFEETGRISSTAGRDLHLPKLPWIR